MRLFGSLIPLLFKRFPDDGEHEALKTVRNDTCSEAAAEEAGDPIRIENHANGLIISDGCLVRLLGRFDNAKTVAAAVGDDGGRESDKRITSKLLEYFVRVGLWDILLQ